MKKRTALSAIYAVIYLALLLVIIFAFALQLGTGNWLQTDLRTLLPTEQQWTSLQQQADQYQEQQLNQQIVLLVRADSKEKSLQQIRQIAQKWRATGLFAEVFDQVQPDLTQLKQEIQQLKLATLPATIRQQLQNAPQQYFQQYAEQIVNPFEFTNLLTLEQDWLGFARFTLAQSQLQSKMQWDADSGLIYILDQQNVWGVLRAVLKESNLINPTQTLPQLLQASRAEVEAENGQLIATGSALFSAQAKQQAEREMLLMSCFGIGLTLLLLISVFRSLKALWLLLPIGIGMLTGIVASIMLFGQIHILTLVIGTSLIGVLIDFPLHWLSSALFSQKWHSEKTMQALKFTFLISLLITLLGYGLLAFTSLTVLKQTALFSATALINAWLTTLLFLPRLLHRYPAQQRSAPRIFQAQFSTQLSKIERALICLISIGLAMGIYKSQWQDDIRQWVSMPPTMLMEAKQISDLTGIDLGSQYFLIIANSENELLAKAQKLSDKLTQQNIAFQSLSQWLMSETQQQALIQQLSKLQAQDYQILAEIGIPMENIATAIAQLSQQPTLSLTQAFNTQLAQGWKTLYLGQIENQFVSLIKIKNPQNLTALADPKQGIYWQDKRTHLNQAFQATRDQAAILKLLSFLLAGGLLCYYFGLRQTANMLLIPFVAILSTIGIFGWLGIPISLFAMFGLLLVSAIGIDYTAYMQTAPETTAEKRVAISLAATTTLISFLLLGLSSTPAVASFGLSVSIGVLISILLTFRFLR